MKEKLELLVERLADREFAQRDNALTILKQEVAGATKTMTSVPKPLKFLSPHFNKMKTDYEQAEDDALKVSEELTLIEMKSSNRSLLIMASCCLKS